MLIVCIALAAGFVLDMVWALCVDAIAKRRQLMASNLSVLLYLCTIVSTILIVERNFFAVAAYAVGGWLGTYLTVGKKKNVKT
jgi:hypothetical protein